jgi:Na+-translocating ferredoxin:NAD+ oxidoreductase subunit D
MTDSASTFCSALTDASAAAVSRGDVTASNWLLTHSGITLRSYLTMHVMGALFPLTAGILFYGWRAGATVAIVLLFAAAGTALWRRVGARGEALRYSHTLWLALLLALTLPPHLLTANHVQDRETISTWPILPAVGLAVAICSWLLGGIGSGRVHPVLVIHLLIVALFSGLVVPHVVLQRHRAVMGDVLDAGPREVRLQTREPWITMPPIPGRTALPVEPASQRLIFFTSGNELPERSWLSLESLIRDRMPPLEDLIIGGHPGPIGTSSAIAVIIGGLFLLYRGLIDYRVPLLIVLSAYACFLVLPIPVVITEQAPHWRWIPMREPGIDWTLAMTFAHFELMASPLLFSAFFLATAPAIRPLAHRARVVYAILIGALTAALQLYASVSFGPYLALLMVSLLTPALDRWSRPRTLV